MMEWPLRLLAFACVLGLMLAWEQRCPARPAPPSNRRRRVVNLLLLATSVTASRLVVPAGLVGVAAWAAQHHLGLFNRLDIDPFVAGTIGLLTLDLAVYAQHRAAHAWPLLWRLHRVHHADIAVDVTTAVRFHPGEIVASLGWKALVVGVLGIGPLIALVFELGLNLLAMYNHGNVRPVSRRPPTGTLLVTPAMHRIHHWAQGGGQARNFGFSITWWDRLFGSYQAPQPTDAAQPLGLNDPAAQPAGAGVIGLLWMPFRTAGETVPPPGPRE